MGDGSSIEWTDATWNPTSGCTKVSQGCEHCYITRTPPFRMQRRAFLPLEGPEVGKSTGVRLHPERLEQPFRWRTSRRVFVDSLSDLAHADVPDSFIAQVFAVMGLTRRHRYQLLSKRPRRLRALLTSEQFMQEVRAQAARISASRGLSWPPPEAFEWPLPNVWVGTSVESQKWADVRIPLLQATPAAVRFLSCEPLLGPVQMCRCDGAHYEVVRHPFLVAADCPLHGQNRLDWVIAGGESGPAARPVDPAWVRRLRDQCQAAGVAFFFKQWGEWAPDHSGTAGDPEMRWVGKKKAGRELDGRVWDDMPTNPQTAGLSDPVVGR